MAAQSKDSKVRPRYRDLVYGLAAPVSFLDIFAYLRFGASTHVGAAFRYGPARPSLRSTPTPARPHGHGDG